MSSEPREESCDLLVIGAGLAGLAACYRATELGVQPRLLSRGIGASQMMSGAADIYSGDEPMTVTGDDNRWTSEFLARLGWCEGPAHVATSYGLLRETRFFDSGVLPFFEEEQVVGVVSGVCEGFEPADLVAALASEALALGLGVRFVSPTVELFTRSELCLPLSSFVSLMEDEERVKKLLSDLGSCSAWPEAVAAVLTGPWLSERILAEAPCRMGQVLSPPDGSVGRRFEGARDAFLGALGISLEVAEVSEIVPREGLAEVIFRGAREREELIRSANVVVATGGMVGGGVRLVPGKSVGSHWKRAVDLPRAPGAAELEGWDPARRPKQWLLSGNVPQQETGPVRSVGDARVSDWGEPWTGGLLDAIRSGRRAVDDLFSKESRG